MKRYRLLGCEWNGKNIFIICSKYMSNQNSNNVFHEHEGFTWCVYGFMTWNCLYLYILYLLYILVFILSVTSSYYELLLLLFLKTLSYLISLIPVHLLISVIALIYKLVFFKFVSTSTGSSSSTHRWHQLHQVFLQSRTSTSTNAPTPKYISPVDVAWKDPKSSCFYILPLDTVRFYVQTTINLQRKCLGTSDCRNMENILIDYIWLNVQAKYLIQTILYHFKWDMALWKWPKCPQYMQRNWWQRIIQGWRNYFGNKR